MSLHPHPTMVSSPRRVYVLVATLLAVALLTACNSNSQSSSSGLRVALVLSGPISDTGWNAGAYQGLLAVRAALHLTPENAVFVENENTSSLQEKNLRDFASKGFNIVFAHGTEYEVPALQMEGDFPNTLFVISSGSRMGHNTTPIVLKLEDGAYLLGMLAAGMSHTHILAEVGAEATTPVRSVFSAFKLGARAVDPTIKIEPAIYTDSWDDANKAREATLPLIDGGADVVMQDLDAASTGVFDAVRERTTPAQPVYALGTNNNQNGAAPDVILASATIDIGKAFVQIANAVAAKKFKPNNTAYDMKSGVIGFVLNPALESRIPPDLKSQLVIAQKQIVRHTLQVPGP